MYQCTKGEAEEGEGYQTAIYHWRKLSNSPFIARLAILPIFFGKRDGGACRGYEPLWF